MSCQLPIPTTGNYLTKNGSSIKGFKEIYEELEKCENFNKIIYLPNGKILKMELADAIKIYEDEKTDSLDCILLIEKKEGTNIYIRFFPIVESA
jgi:hypothetical protein